MNKLEIIIKGYDRAAYLQQFIFNTLCTLFVLGE